MNATELKEKKNNPSSSHTDIVGVYLGEIARFPMLDPSEEIILGKQVQRMMSCRETKQKLEQDTELSQMILDDSPTPEDYATQGLMRQDVEKMLAELKP